MRPLIVILFTLASFRATARAEEAVHVGVDARTDLGTHHLRLPIGYRKDCLDTTLVFDPAAFLDGMHDFDLLFERYIGPRVGLLAGYRWSAIAVDGGLHHQHRTLIGVTGIGPSFFDNRLRTSFSFEVATLWVKHGGGAETEWISADRDLLDHFSLGIFLRIDYERML